jgi:hypothetical protein
MLGPLGLGWFKDDVSQVGFRMLVDLTLALILFIDAANADISTLRRQWRIPTRMLGLGLPGAIALGFIIAAWLFDNLTVYEAALLATMLAATDAALGKAVVSNPAVPSRLREGLNSESGLNDGLCVPILLVFIALAQGSVADEATLALTLVAKELGIGAVVGLVVAGSGARVLDFCHKRDWISEVWMQVSVPALAIASFAIAQSLHGSGYIAAFVGGMLFGFMAKSSTHKLVMPGEAISESMAMLTWAHLRRRRDRSERRRIHLGDRRLRDLEPHADPDVADLSIANRYRRDPVQQAVSRLVRSSRSGQHRIRHHRAQRRPAGWRIPGHGGDLHGGVESHRPRGQRQSARGLDRTEGIGSAHGRQPPINTRQGRRP